MSDMEVLVLIASGVGTGFFLRDWYRPLVEIWPRERFRDVRMVLRFLPAAALLIMAVSLTALASFDVVGDFGFILFYLILGFGCLCLCMRLFSRVVDLHLSQDAMLRGNRAALWAIAGGFLGMTLIYAGANVGDGPGWWCVIFAGGLGLAAFLALALLICWGGGASERITVDHDLATGVRFGAYLLASGLILARASAGDWTSFGATIVEFFDGWPVLLLAALSLAVERYRLRREARAELTGAVVTGALYLLLALLAILLLPPLRENPIYDRMGAGL